MQLENDPDLLEYMYWDEGLSTKDIAREIGRSQWTVINRMRKFGILIRSCSEGTALKWKDPDYIAKQQFTEERRRNHALGWSEERRRVHSDMLREQWEDEEYRKVQIERISGENSSCWRGGPRPYPREWTGAFKERIRKRDGYMCVLCGAKNGDRAHDVHHINYIKEDTVPDNCVTLCRPCHMMINVNKNYWQDILCDLMDARDL